MEAAAEMRVLGFRRRGAYKEMNKTCWNLEETEACWEGLERHLEEMVARREGLQRPREMKVVAAASMTCSSKKTASRMRVEEAK